MGKKKFYVSILIVIAGVIAGLLFDVAYPLGIAYLLVVAVNYK